jgi:hypothetical protein
MNLAWFSLFMLAMALPQGGGQNATKDDSKDNLDKLNRIPNFQNQTQTRQSWEAPPDMMREVSGLIIKTHRGRIRSLIIEVVVSTIVGLMFITLIVIYIYHRVKQHRKKKDAKTKNPRNSMGSGSEEGTLNASIHEDEYQRPKSIYSWISLPKSSNANSVSFSHNTIISKSSFVGSASKYGLKILKDENNENNDVVYFTNDQFKKESMIKPGCLQHASSVADSSPWRLSCWSELSYLSRLSAISEASTQSVK